MFAAHVRDVDTNQASSAAGLFNDERLWIASRVYCITMFGFVVWFLLTQVSGGVIVPNGDLLGADFISFYSASRLALDGQPGAAYSMAAHYAAQTNVFGHEFGYSAFFYPPVYLLLCLPLALVPYFWALALFQFSTLLLYWHVVRKFGGRHLETMFIFSFPAVFVNLGHGQNGFLSAALFGGALLCLKARPLIAGILFGCLIYKPQLGIVIPFALIAARCWTTIASATATALTLALAATLVFGVDIWHSFLANAPWAAAALEHGLVGPHKMQSTYAAVRVLGGGSVSAWILQAIVTFLVLGVLIWATARMRRPGLDVPLMAVAALLTSPFLLDYDLALLAVPLAWLYAEGTRTGFRSGEKLIGVVAFVLPLISRSLAGSMALPIAPLVIGALFVVLLRRAATDNAAIDCAGTDCAGTDRAGCDAGRGFFSSTQAAVPSI